MPTLTIRNLEHRTHRAIRERAAHNAISMEEQVRRILKREFNPDQKTPADMAKHIHARLLGFHELEDICNQPQTPFSEPISFSQ